MQMKMWRLVGAAGLLVLMTVLLAPLGAVQAVALWQTETVDSEGVVGLHTSLALDGQNQPHISYYDGVNQDLKYAVSDGTDWQIETVDAPGEVGEYNSLALDSQGLPHISYYDRTNKDLKYANFDGTDWQIEAIDTGADVGWYTSLALDGLGRPHISYYDLDNYDLKYAAFDGTNWKTEIADAAGIVSLLGTSLAIDAQNRPHISYNASVNLKYATFDGTDWQIETVDAGGDVGEYTSLALDSLGRPHISYVDNQNDDLKYATFDGADWQIEIADAGDGIGTHTSLALDNQNQPHISYYEFNTDSLTYATFDGMDWRIETADSGGLGISVGRYSSLALDSVGLPRISYYDETNGDLKYTKLSVNDAPAVDAGGPYGGAEGSTIDLGGTVSDAEADPLTTTWSYTIDSADAGATCTFADASEVNTTVTCTDDGSYTLTLTADDGHNPLVSNSAMLTISNASPQLDLGDDVAINEGEAFTAAGSFSDPGGNDSHTATVEYGDDTGVQPLTLNTGGIFSLNHGYASQGQYTVEVCVNDDDGGMGCDELVVTVINQPPTTEVGGPYDSLEGSPVSLQGEVSDPESDDLTTTWSYQINDADPGTSCSFADASQIKTTFSCTDDGTFTVTLTASDGSNPTVSDSATVTIANANPMITEPTATLAGSRVTIDVDAADPGTNDVLSYAFDCDANGDYEVEAGSIATTTCSLNPQQEGSFTFGVQVSDDDDGIATKTVTVTIFTELCASNYTGLLRYTDDCQRHETAISIPDPAGPVMLCTSVHNGLLRAPLAGVCAGHEIHYALPEDGPLNVCINTYTLTMRVVDGLGRCTSDEFGRVIAATEFQATTPPRTH